MAHNLAETLHAFFKDESIVGLISAYLFGSQAAGRSHRESDVDVAVLLDIDAFPTRARRFDVRLDLIARLSRRLGTSAIDLTILNDAPPHLVRRIMTDGARLFCADTERDHAARRTAMSRAADLEPFLRRARTTKLRAIAR